MAIELMIGNSLAAIKLFDPVPNLCFDRHSILCKPSILFLLSF